MRKIKNIISLVLFSIITLTASAQELNVKTNLLYDATTTINLGAELRLGKRTSLEVSGNYNPWTFADNKKMKLWMVQPEFRYWLCETFNGHFFGVHALGGQFNFNHIKLPFGLYPELENNNYQGDYIGGGIAYGYQWILGNRWALEATIGVGYVYINYDKFTCATCGQKLYHSTKNYFGPTKAGLSLTYFIF